MKNAHAQARQAQWAGPAQTVICQCLRTGNEWGSFHWWGSTGGDIL